MKKIHIALSTNDIEKSIVDYTKRIGKKPCVVAAQEYALWRTETLNLSIRYDPKTKPGELRHLGWEDAHASAFTKDVDCNGITWEHFNAKQQAQEINEIWPGTNFEPI